MSQRWRCRFFVVACAAALVARSASASDPAPAAAGDDASALRVDDHPDVDAPLPGRVRALVIEGLVRTERSVVVRELQWFEGQSIDEHAWDLGLRRLWNTVLFSRIDTRRVAVEPGLFDVLVSVDENFTLYPSFSGVATDDVLWFRTGVSETNLGGRYRELSVHYEQFNDAIGGQVAFRNPRLFDERRELYVAAARVARPRPTFTLLRTLARVDLSELHHDDRLRVGLRLEGGFDDYTSAIDGTQQPQPSNAYGTLGASVRLGRVDRTRLEYEGESVELATNASYTPGPSGFFPSVLSDARVFRRLPGRINVAVRGLAAATAASTDNFRLYVGGLETVRGYPDSYANGASYVATNAELRWSALDWRYFVVMPTVFVDAALVGHEHAGHRRLVSVGAGVRFLLPTFAAAGVRADVAMPLTDGFGPSLSVGAYQFFF